MSREREIDQVLDALRDLWRQHPTWRLGQLVANLTMWAKGVENGAQWDMEDQEAKEAILKHLANRPE